MNIPFRLAVLLLIPLSVSRAQTPSQLKSEEEVMRAQMVHMSKQLGVTCTTCHNSENFKSDKKNEFKVAKEHMKLTQLLIDGGMNGLNKNPKASCYMCHRGQLHPAWQMPGSDLPKK